MMSNEDAKAQGNCGETKLKNVGSRNSQLALIQTRIVIEKLVAHQRTRGGCEIGFKIIGMTTAGDRILDKALPDIGSKSLFTKDLEVALLDGKVDFIVHSLKDLPTTLPDGCVIGAVLQRDDPNDSIVLKRSLRDRVNPMSFLFGTDRSIDGHASGVGEITIGTSSQRRIAMIRRCNPKIKCINIRGNLNTRLSKLDQYDSGYDAIILAKAGLDRMDWTDRSSTLLKPEVDSRLSSWCYAVGQGAIAVECRANDKSTLDLLSSLCDLKTTYEVIAERSLMKTLEGGCSIPLGVRSTWSGSTLSLSSVVLSIDGRSVVEANDRINIESPKGIGEKIPDPSDTTGVVLSDQIDKASIARDIMIACSSLGVRVANKMIELGCLDLIRDSR